MKTHRQDSSEHPFVLEPLAIWKWLIVISLLLGFPFFILIDQMTNSYKSSRERKVQKFELEVEKIAGRAFVEQNPEIQLKEILAEYVKRIEEPVFNLHILRMHRLAFSPLPFVSVDEFNRLLEIYNRQRLENYERILRRLIPGIKLLKWNSSFEITSESDTVLPKFVFYKLIEAISIRVKHRRNAGETFRSYADQLLLVKKFYNDDEHLYDFIKFGRLTKFTSSSGVVQYLKWTDFDMNLNLEHEVSACGLLAIIDEAELPVTFGITRFNARKSHEWKRNDYALGWIDSGDAARNYLPYPFLKTDLKRWADWCSDQPNGVYEKDGLLLAIRRINSRLVAVAVKSLKEVNLQLEKRIFITYLIFFGLILFAAVLVLGFRRNNGVALSIRWQLLGLFSLALALPSAAVVHFGVELLNDRRQSYENEAFKKLERIRKDIEENKDYVFRHLEKLGDSFTSSMLGFYRADKKVPFAGNGLDAMMSHYFARAGVEHLYLFDDAGEEVLKGRFRSSERKGLLPLVTSLAKLKLRLTGNLKQDGYSGAVSLMDLMLEETGGANLADIQQILKYKSSTAFELKFTNRKTYFFVGQFSPESDPEKVFVMVFIIKDRKFDQLYLDLMIEKLQREEKTGQKIQLFYGKNHFSHNSYFVKTGIKNPFFQYDQQNPDSIGIGKITEPTRFAGVSVSDSYVFSNGRRYLFYSFQLANLDAFSALLLYDYQEIFEKLQVLRILLVVIFLVTLLIIYVLARIATRSILQPVQMLRNAVELVAKGFYTHRLVLPGEDELVDLSRAFNSMSQGLDEREKMTRYLSRSAVEAVKTGEGAQLGGRKIPATILFSDIRSFTTISETNDAETVVCLLNDYFAEMNQVIETFGGDIDKFIGDAIMAQFIAENDDAVSQAESALNAVKCALAMMAALAEFNETRRKQGKFPIMIGVGINSGEVIAGNIGSPGRMDHTVIGDTVNVASRLEGMSKLGRHTHIIISRATLDLVASHIEYEQLEETSVKGKTAAVEMFEVISCN